jgi:hypothetical protein
VRAQAIKILAISTTTVGAAVKASGSRRVDKSCPVHNDSGVGTMRCVHRGNRGHTLPDSAGLFGSFLPSLGRNATKVYPGRGSRHSYEIKSSSRTSNGR